MKHFILSLIVLFSFIHPTFAADKVLDIQKLQTPSGIEIWLVEDHNIPVISMSFSFEGGLALDPKDKLGVGRLVSILLDEGADTLKSQEFQSLLNDNAIHMSFSAGRDAFYGSIKTLTTNKDLAFDLLKKALNAPRFDPDAIERMRQANISKIKNDLGNPSWLVARTFNGVLFEGHPYAQPGYGHLDSMSKITQEDLLSFVKAQFRTEGLKISIAGDITKEDALKLIEHSFSTLPKKATVTTQKKAQLKQLGKTILLPLKTPQTYIAVGEEGIERDDKDWHAAVIMNYILGGSGFDARLMKEIREKRGLTYGVYSQLSTLKDATLLQVSLSTSNDKTAEALNLIRQEWKKMADKGPTEIEIKDAKSYLTGSLLLSLTSTDDISGTLNSLQRDKLDIDYINQRNAFLNAVTIEDVKRVAKRLLKTENLTTILVGTPTNIKPDITLEHPPGMNLEKKK